MHSLEIIKARNEEFAKKELARKQKERDRVLSQLEAIGYVLPPVASPNNPAGERISHARPI